MSRNKTWKQTLLMVIEITVAIFIFLWLYQFVFLRSSSIGIGPLGDEAVLSQGAERVLHGQVPHRDFISTVGGASFYPLAAFFKVFGDSYNVVRAFNFLVALVLSITAVWILRPLTRLGALLAALFFVIIFFPMWPFASYHWQTLLGSLFACGLLLRTERQYYVVAAGAVLGATFFSMYNKALPVAAALQIFLVVFSPLKNRRRRALFFVGSFLLSIIAFAVLMAANGSFIPFFQQVIIDNFRYYHLAINDLYFVFNDTSFILLCMVLGFGAPLLIPGFFSKPQRSIYQGLWLLFVGLGISTLYYLETIHLSYAMLPPLMLAMLFVRQAFVVLFDKPFTWNYRKNIIICILIFSLGTLTFFTGKCFRFAYDPIVFASLSTTTRMPTSRGEVYGNTQWSGTFASAVPAISSIVGSLQGQRIFFFPFCPGCYYFYDIDNPTPVDFVVVDAMSNKNRAWLESTLEQNTDAVVFIPGTWEGFPVDGELMTWIRSHFTNETRYENGQLIVMKKQLN